MTWVTLSNGTCPLFFPLEAGILIRRDPLIQEEKRGLARAKMPGSTPANCGASQREKCYPCHEIMPLACWRSRLGFTDFYGRSAPRCEGMLRKRLFRRDAETSTPDACAPRNGA